MCGGAVVNFQLIRPDTLFNADQQARLSELMRQWRVARDAGHNLSVDEQGELDALIEAELQAAIRRSQQMLHRQENLGQE